MIRSVCLAIVWAGVLALAWMSFQEAEHARYRAERADRLANERAERIATLESQLDAALNSQKEVRTLLEQRNAEQVALRRAQLERLERALAPMPEGLRLALDALHELLRRAGHGDLQVLDARAIEDRKLLGTRVFLAAVGASPGAVLWQAERVAFRLDRSTSCLSMTLEQGVVVRDGRTEPLPESGEVFAIGEVDARLWEERLPMLVEPVGVYPQPEPAVPPRAQLDPFTAQRWRERLDELLASARTALRYRVHSLKGLEQGWFLDVVLYGYAEGNRLEEMVEVRKLALAVDTRAGIAELELVGGVLRRAGGDVTLPEAAPGRKILLPGVSPTAASRSLTGMVLSR